MQACVGQLGFQYFKRELNLALASFPVLHLGMRLAYLVVTPSLLLLLILDVNRCNEMESFPKAMSPIH